MYVRAEWQKDLDWLGDMSDQLDNDLLVRVRDARDGDKGIFQVASYYRDFYVPGKTACAGIMDKIRAKLV